MPKMEASSKAGRAVLMYRSFRMCKIIIHLEEVRFFLNRRPRPSVKLITPIGGRYKVLIQITTDAQHTKISQLEVQSELGIKSKPGQPEVLNRKQKTSKEN
jgi:hypothetical protein